MPKTVPFAAFVTLCVIALVATVALILSVHRRETAVVLRKPLPSRLLPVGRTAAAGDPAVIWVEMLSDSPRVMLFHNFLGADECQALIAMAEPRLARSTVQANGLEESRDRTSYTTNLGKSETLLVRTVERRVVALSGGYPLDNLEPLQVVRYKPGQFYKPHYDYFPRGKKGTAEALRRGGQRTVTFFIYLNALPDDEPGGGTSFPKLGLTVRPRLGTALFFSNLLPDGREDPRVLHSGDTLQHAVKYGLNAWFRQQAFVL